MPVPAPTIDAFRTRYLVSKSVDDNKKWIQMVEAQAADKDKVFFNCENSVLKHLNDKALKEKELPTSLMKFWRERMRAHLSGSRTADLALKARYADYKSDRFIMDSAVSRKEMEAAYTGACRDLDAKIQELGIKFFSPTRAPSTWTLGGSGRTADEASAVAKRARALAPKAAEEGSVVPIQNFDDWVDDFKVSYKEIGRLRTQLSDETKSP